MSTGSWNSFRNWVEREKAQSSPIAGKLYAVLRMAEMEPGTFPTPKDAILARLTTEFRTHMRLQAIGMGGQAKNYQEWKLLAFEHFGVEFSEINEGEGR